MKIGGVVVYLFGVVVLCATHACTTVQKRTATPPNFHRGGDTGGALHYMTTVAKEVLLGDREELILNYNPAGGRPMQIGHTVWRNSHDISLDRVEEYLEVRLHIGYCPCGCGRKIVVSPQQAAKLLEIIGQSVYIPKRRKWWWIF